MADQEQMRAIKIFARVIGISAAIFVLLSQDGVGPPVFDSVGKALFWSGVVLVSVFFLNTDLLRYTSGKVLLLLVIVFQSISVYYAFGHLQKTTFITLGVISFLECLVLMLPLMVVRKRHRGVWY